jgi:hypothetical protein
MSTVKSLPLIALLVGGTSLAIAQNGPATGGQPPVAGGAAASGQNSDNDSVASRDEASQEYAHGRKEPSA